jgi:hypothetical protein
MLLAAALAIDKGFALHRCTDLISTLVDLDSFFLTTPYFLELQREKRSN